MSPSLSSPALPTGLLDKNLAFVLAERLQKADDKVILKDSSRNFDAFSGKRVLIGALLLSEKLRELFDASPHAPRHLGILLPAGIAGALGNLACLFADGVCVNLNPLTARKDFTGFIQHTEINQQAILGSRLYLEKLGMEIPDTVRLLDIGDLLGGLSKLRAVSLALRLKMGLGGVLKSFQVEKTPARAAAIIVPTSGSCGIPKAAVLTHGNLIANLWQVNDLPIFDKESILLSNLPLFHSFGLTVGLLLPIFKGCQVVTHPNPRDIKQCAKIVRQEQCTLMIAVPSLLRLYLKVEANLLSSLKAVVAGAEKLPHTLQEKWDALHPDIPLFEGYGLTESSPVVSINYFDSPTNTHHKKGSVGRIVRGMEVKITHPESGEALPNTETGMLHLKGPNIFDGYFKDPQATEDSLQNKWLRTGDIGRLDQDQFLYIEGRLKRFSKINGEMVSHQAVQEALFEVLPSLENSEIAVSSTAKSEESLVVVWAKGEGENTPPTLPEIRRALSKEGYPAAFGAFSALIEVDSLPCLGNGKLDLRKLNALAETQGSTHS